MKLITTLAIVLLVSSCFILVASGALYPKTLGVSYSCCGSTAYDVATLACCNNRTVFNPSLDTCCSSSTSGFSYVADGKLPECCKYSSNYAVTFDPTKQVCCPTSRNLLLDIPADPSQNGVCCAGRLLPQGFGCCNGASFDLSSEVCCGQFVTDLPRGHDSCCIFYNSASVQESKTYDSSKQTCCAGSLASEGGVINGVGTDCCGKSISKSVAYDTSKAVCCLNKLFKGSNGCCGKKGYNKERSVCTNGKVLSKGSAICEKKVYKLSEKTCCIKSIPRGGAIYTLTNGLYSCCDGKAMTKKDTVCCGNVEQDGDSCCGSSGYFASKGELCCGSQIIRNPQFGDRSKCCGNQVYNSQVNACCSGVLYDPDEQICCLSS